MDFATYLAVIAVMASTAVISFLAGKHSVRKECKRERLRESIRRLQQFDNPAKQGLGEKSGGIIGNIKGNQCKD